MVTLETLEVRFSECGYPEGKNRLSAFEAAFRGDMIIIIERPGFTTYVGAYAKDKCRPLTEVFPNHVTES